MTLSRLGRIVESTWFAIPTHFPAVALDAFAIMPNHIHGTIFITELRKSAAASQGSLVSQRPRDSNVSVGAQQYQASVGAQQYEASVGAQQYEASVGAQQYEASVGAQHAAPKNPPGVAPGSLGAIVRSFKSAVTKEANERLARPRTPLWQRNYHERVLRSEEELENVRRYIIGNPQTWDDDEENPMRRPD